MSCSDCTILLPPGKLNSQKNLTSKCKYVSYLGWQILTAIFYASEEGQERKVSSRVTRQGVKHTANNSPLSLTSLENPAAGEFAFSHEHPRVNKVLLSPASAAAPARGRTRPVRSELGLFN